MKKRGQFSIEFMLIIAFVILLLIGGVSLYYYFSGPVQETTTRSSADYMLNQIVAQAEDVYSLGEGSRNTVTVRIPPNVQSITFSGYEVFMTIESAGQKTYDVVSESSVKFFDKVINNPPEGKNQYVLTAQKDVTDVKICVAESNGVLTC